MQCFFLNLCKFKANSIYLFTFKLYMEHLISDRNYKEKMMQDLAIPCAQFCVICADPFFWSVRGSFNGRILICSVKHPAQFCAV